MPLDVSSFWALVGVALGFSLGEGSRLIRGWFRILRLKRLIRTELVSIQKQIPQKREIIGKMIRALKRGRVMPGASVRIVSTGYDRHASEVYEHLSVVQRNCLHVIHERMRVADQLLDNFLDDFQAASRDKIMENPIEGYTSILSDLDQSYETAIALINSYLSGNPIDVFAVKIKAGKK